MDQAKSFGLLIAAARTWVGARAKLRRALDSKRARPSDVEAAQKAVTRAGNELEEAVRRFDASVRLPARQSKKVDWGDLAGAVAKLAGGIEQAVKSSKIRPRVEIIDAEVIDTDGKTV